MKGLLHLYAKKHFKQGSDIIRFMNEKKHADRHVSNGPKMTKLMVRGLPTNAL